MMPLRRLHRDYEDAGALNELLAVWGFVDDRTFLTKAGHVGVVYRVAGIDDEGLTVTERDAVVHRFEAALRSLDEHQRLYQYLIKETAAPFTSAPCDHPVVHDAVQRRAAALNARRDTLFDLSLYLVLIHEDPTPVTTHTELRQVWRAPLTAVRQWLSLDHTVQCLASDLDRAVTTLHHKADALEVQLDEIRLERLSQDDAFQFLRRLINYDADPVSERTCPSETHLDYFVADAAVECYRDHLVVGDQAVKVLSMKDPPSHTFAHLLGDLQTVPGAFIACLEWQRVATDQMRRTLQTRRRHFFNSRVSMVNYLSRETRSDDMLVDESAGATVQQLGEALTELDVHHHFFGLCSLTLVLHGADRRTLAQQAAQATKTLALHDGSFFDETYNLLNAWLSVVPGNSAHNVRRLALLETNVSDLSLLFARDQGDRVSPHLGREALAVFDTPHQTAYAFNLHVDDVGHTLVLGATGSGKSFLLNFLVTQAQKYAPRTIILDLGQSYRKLATLLEGGYLELGLRQHDVTLNPFAFDPTPEHLHFLHAFVQVLLEGDGEGRLTDLEDREVYDAIESLYVLDAGQRRLGTLAAVLPRPLAARLHRWVEGGRYGGLFDHLEDTLTIDRLQVLDFDAMRTYPALLEPLLFYVLHRVSAQIHDPEDAGRLKLCVLDEAWRFIQHPTLRAYVQEGLKTWRKSHAAMILATQSVDDFASADLLRTVVESCPTTLLLANPNLDPQQVAEVFHLNETELALLADLIPRRQLLLKRPGVTKVLTLDVDPASYWIYTNTPMDNERLAQAMKDGGFAAGLDHLVQTGAPNKENHATHHPA